MTQELDTVDVNEMAAVVGAGPGWDAAIRVMDRAGDWGEKHGGWPLELVSSVAAVYPAVAYGLGVGAYHMIKG